MAPRGSVSQVVGFSQYCKASGSSAICWGMCNRAPERAEDRVLVAIVYCVLEVY